MPSPKSRNNPLFLTVGLTFIIVATLAIAFLINRPREPDQSGEQPSTASDPVPGENDPAVTTEVGKELYAQHCTSCHGDRGDGKGIAASFLYPKPRNFIKQFRLISTSNNIASREDIHAVLVRGMPGSSMPPWAHLSQQQRDALVDEVLRLRREGTHEQYVNLLRDEDGLTDEEIAADDVQEEIQDLVARMTTPGKSSEVPQFSPSDDMAIARGQEVYAKNGCLSCHGKDGKGDGVQEMFDEDNLPTTARDFTLGIFKGNYDPPALYRRIAYGMPGSPMPGSTQMKQDQMMDLVHYLRSMSSEEQREATVLNREEIVAQVIAVTPTDPHDSAWSSVNPVSLRMTPLWWRNDTSTDLAVQALHDGKSLAVRVSWSDPSHDEHAVDSSRFEDAVAIELYQGDAEPFIGMGGPNSPIDVWFWDADRQGGPKTIEDLYPNSVVDIYPFNEKVADTAEMNRDGSRSGNQPDISLPARASGNQIMPTSDSSGASSLSGVGPGSVTFRIPKNQLVTATGAWKEERWTVVLSRQLTVDPQEEGVSLEPGTRASVAFAVWDGSHRDRDGQKLITIWQDLVLGQ